MAIPLAALSLLLVPAITTGVVVAQGLGSFSTPYQSAAATRGTTTAPEAYQGLATRIDKYWDQLPRGRIPQAIDTSAAAAPLIMLTGREFLPIGGFSGNVPSPTLALLRHLIHTGQITQVFVPVKPAGRDPRLVWIRRHCLQTFPQPYGTGVEFALYFCLPAKVINPTSVIGQNELTSNLIKSHPSILRAESTLRPFLRRSRGSIIEVAWTAVH